MRQYSTALTDAINNVYETTIGASPKLQFRTGPPPLNCAAADTGLLLAELTLPADWMADSANGVKLKAGTWSGTASLVGTIGHYRLKDAAGSITHDQGLASDLVLPNTQLQVGQPIVVSSWSRRARPTMVRGFHFPSYSTNDLAATSNASQMDAYISQLPNATHAVATVHVRIQGGATGNTVARGSISETPGNLLPWLNLARTKGLRVGVSIITFIDDWTWAGDWNPSTPSSAFLSYYNAIKPYLQAAEASKAEFVILCDEWSTLFATPPGTEFTTLFNNARTDYGGPIGVNLNSLQEPECAASVISLCNFVGVTTYIPTTLLSVDTYANMKANLMGPASSTVPVVANKVSEYATIWVQPTINTYCEYLKYLAETVWSKQILLSIGYKSTPGAAANPCTDITETTVDQDLQKNAWSAYIDAMKDASAGIGQSLMGILGWRWFPITSSDPTGFTIQDKTAAPAIVARW